MKNETHIGLNRTGIAFSPLHSQELIDAAEEMPASQNGHAEAIAHAREHYASLAEPIGSMPPAKRLDVETTPLHDENESLVVLGDKLGERLAFERTGCRLYEALLAKFHTSEKLPNGPTEEDLREIHEDERAHLLLLRDVSHSLGVDPTVVTPSADIASVSSMGILQVLSDPRTSFKQCLEAILIAELADNDGWDLLVRLARQLGFDDLADPFSDALADEERHVALVRSWVMDATLRESRIGGGDED